MDRQATREHVRHRMPCIHLFLYREMLTMFSCCDRSDADADVLADYVLALLRHDGDAQDVRKLFESEIPDFLKEGKLRPSS